MRLRQCGDRTVPGRVVLAGGLRPLVAFTVVQLPPLKTFGPVQAVKAEVFNDLPDRVPPGAGFQTACALLSPPTAFSTVG